MADAYSSIYMSVVKLLNWNMRNNLKSSKDLRRNVYIVVTLIDVYQKM